MATGKSRNRRSAPDGDPSSQHAGDALKQYVAEMVAEQVAEKVAAQVDKINRKVQGLGVTYDALDLWTRSEPAARRPRFTRDEIAAAAIHIADTEGIDALSMRRLATELDAGTMTLYHYMRTKDELLTLVTDAVMAEIVLPDDALPEDDWRVAMTAIAHSSKAVLERHPWVFDIVEDPGSGPNGVRHFDQSLRAISSLPGSFADKLDVIFAVDEYVFGHCLHARNHHADDASGPVDAAMKEYVAELAGSGDYPQIAALIEERGIDAVWGEIADHSRDETRFARNLARLLDGIARDL